MRLWDRLLLRPTETFAGNPEHCRMMDDSPNDRGVANAWDSSDARGVHEDRPSRGPKSPFPSRPRPTSGLAVGLRAWVFPTGGCPLVARKIGSFVASEENI